MCGGGIFAADMRGDLADALTLQEDYLRWSLSE